MPAEWDRLYREAMQELDVDKLTEICEHTRASINARLLDLAGLSIGIEKEREELFQALRGLLVHEQQRRAPN
jgi:hypothetical protein